MRLPALPAPGQTVLGGVLTRHEGGKGANQAVAAARAGGRAHFVGAVGEADGEPSVAALAADGVDVTAVERVSAPDGARLRPGRRRQRREPDRRRPGRQRRLSTGR